MGEMAVAVLLGLGHRRLHGLAVVAVERVALDDGGIDVLPSGSVLEGLVTVDMPAPEEPVMAMTDRLTDGGLNRFGRGRLPKSGRSWLLWSRPLHVVLVVLMDASTSDLGRR